MRSVRSECSTMVSEQGSVSSFFHARSRVPPII
jgi:hypothetical protein